MRKILLISTIVLAYSANVAAVDLSAPPPKPCASRAQQCRNPWKITIAPYVWGMNLNGSIKIGNRNAPVNDTFSDILRDFQGGGMLWLDATKDKWGIFLNSVYADLHRTYQVDTTQVKPIIKFGLFSAGLSYEAFSKTFRNCTKFSLIPYIGARYTVQDVKIEVVGTTLQSTHNERWIDPIIGSSAKYVMNKNWLATIAADIGGTGSDQKSYNLNGYVGYKPTNKCVDLTLYAGYRYLYQKYQNDENPQYIWNMHMFGPVLGMAFTF